MPGHPRARRSRRQVRRPAASRILQAARVDPRRETGTRAVAGTWWLLISAPGAMLSALTRGPLAEPASRPTVLSVVCEPAWRAFVVCQAAPTAGVRPGAGTEVSNAVRRDHLPGPPGA